MNPMSHHRIYTSSIIAPLNQPLILSHSWISMFCPCFLCNFLVFLGFSIVNMKITIVSESSQNFALKEEDTVTVQRLFHISTWTSTRVPWQSTSLISHSSCSLVPAPPFGQSTLLPLFSLFLSFHSHLILVGFVNNVCFIWQYGGLLGCDYILWCWGHTYQVYMAIWAIYCHVFDCVDLVCQTGLDFDLGFAIGSNLFLLLIHCHYCCFTYPLDYWELGSLTGALITVWRLFHISTWTSTMCTLAINILYLRSSHSLSFVSSFPPLNRHVAATVFYCSLVPQSPYNIGATHSKFWILALEKCLTKCPTSQFEKCKWNSTIATSNYIIRTKYFLAFINTPPLWGCCEYPGIT